MSQTLPLQTKISLSTSFSEEASHRIVEFGDGYVQRSPSGLNPSKRRVNIIHENLDSTDANTLISFYKSRMNDADAVDIAANELFYEDGLFYVESFNVEMSDHTSRTVTATMIEVYDI